MHPRETNQAKRKQTQYGGGHTCSSPAGPRPGRCAGKRLGHWPQGSFPRAKGGLGTRSSGLEPVKEPTAQEGRPGAGLRTPERVRPGWELGDWRKECRPNRLLGKEETQQSRGELQPHSPVPSRSSTLKACQGSQLPSAHHHQESKPSASRFVPCCFRGFMPELRTRPWPHSSLQEGGKPTGFLATAWQPLVP